MQMHLMPTWLLLGTNKIVENIFWLFSNVKHTWKCFIDDSKFYDSEFDFFL